MATDGTARKRILLTNDDGLAAPGLTCLLHELVKSFDVRVVAPERQQSGTGHAITLHEPLFAREAKADAAAPAFAVLGTPADCVKVALTNLFPDFQPDLVVSGINRGPNVGVNVLYSGTVAAALEAVVNGIPAVAVSLDDGPEFHFQLAAELAIPILDTVLSRGLPPAVAVNVNIPNRPREEILGLRLTRQGTSGFREYYVEEPAEAKGRRFRLEGTMVIREDDPDVDAVALSRGFISVSPLGLQLNSAEAAAALASWPGFADGAAFGRVRDRIGEPS